MRSSLPSPRNYAFFHLVSYLSWSKLQKYNDHRIQTTAEWSDFKGILKSFYQKNSDTNIDA